MTAIYFHPEAYTTTGPRLMGRNAAGESFLRGYLSSSSSDSFCAFVEQEAHGRIFRQLVRDAGHQTPTQVLNLGRLGALAQSGCLHVPGPGLGEQAWHRAHHGHGSWSLTGITHTTSSALAMDALVDLLNAPVQPWDALICTSVTVQDNVRRVLSAQVDYLRDRFGATRFVLPQLPVIPLGVHARDFEFSAEQRWSAREALGCQESTLVVLYMGRLSFHAKAHPLAMYQALEIARRDLTPGQEVLLVECGWHANEHIASAFQEAAREACPGVRTVHLDGRSSEARNMAWAAADVFCSLSDNIQETFGITPVEAMAAGLPVVVSDWDGYKDTVRHKVDGFRIPTLVPAAGLGADLALRHARGIDTYDVYCGLSCSLIAVSVELAAEAFRQLFSSASLRQQMGEAGRQRVREVFDWVRIIPVYEKLWDELGAIRREHGARASNLKFPVPARLDPFHAFASYPSQTLLPDTVLRLCGSTEVARQKLETFRNLAMVDFARNILPRTDEHERMLARLAEGPCPAGDLVADIPEAQRSHVFRSLAWLCKMGVMEFVENVK